VPQSERQAGTEIPITEEMIAAGAIVYEEWEPNHIFGDQWSGAAPYAIRELVVEVFRAMADRMPQQMREQALAPHLICPWQDH
jgi:hypothetical protein